jgi:hypothetical protein
MTTNIYTIKEYTRNEEDIIEYTGRETDFKYDTDFAISLDQAANDVAAVIWGDHLTIEYNIKSVY